MQNWAKEALPLAERYQTEAMAFDRIRLELEPILERTLSMLEPHSVDEDLLDHFWAELKEIQTGIDDWRGEPPESIDNSPYSQPKISSATYWSRYQNISMLIRQVARAFRQGDETFGESDEAIKRWIARHDKIEGWARTIRSNPSVPLCLSSGWLGRRRVVVGGSGK